MWRPKQKALGKTSGVATPEVRLSREEKGKMPACSNNAASREDTRATVPSPNSRSVAPRASLVLMSEATVTHRTRGVHSHEAQVKAQQRASFALRSRIKGLSLSADSVAYAASAPKGVFKDFAARLEPKHYLRPIAFAAAQRIKHHSVLRPPVRQALSSCLATELWDCP